MIWLYIKHFLFIKLSKLKIKALSISNPLSWKLVYNKIIKIRTLYTKFYSKISVSNNSQPQTQKQKKAFSNKTQTIKIFLIINQIFNDKSLYFTKTTTFLSIIKWTFQTGQKILQAHSLRSKTLKQKKTLQSSFEKTKEKN